MKKVFFVMMIIVAVFFACEQNQQVQTNKPNTEHGQPLQGDLKCDQDYPTCQTGVASYYADKYHGRETASGALYDKGAMTAAHREHAFGTRLKVTNEAGASAVVTVNDRGPHARGRIIDLSRAAAVKLGMIDDGWQRVIVERIQE